MKNIKEKINGKLFVIIGIILISIVLAGLTECYLLKLEENIEMYIQNIINNIHITKIIILTIIYSIIGILIYFYNEQIYKHRYIIAILLFCICVIFEISGSSIGMFNTYFNLGLEDNGLLLGISRAIRTDEWAVNTPFAFSQGYDQNPYSYQSSTIRGTSTDVFITYGQPITSPLMVYRIFQIGYILFGAAKGLSIFWCGRFIALFLVMFEFMMLITNKNKKLSLIGAILTLFAPVVQWWFAINGLVEMLISGSLAILMLQKYMTTDNFKKRCLYTVVMIICAGTYALTLYPAWQIPFVYVYLAVAIWVIISNYKDCKISKKDILVIILAIIILIASIGYVFVHSYDTIMATFNTVYPGNVQIKGGGSILKYFSYISNLFFSIKDSNLPTNTCEASVFFDLFPIGYILTGIVLLKDKNKDKLLIPLLIVSAFLGMWCIVGYPSIIAKITLLFKSQTDRTFIAIGFLNIIMLIRALAIIKEPINKKISIIISILLAIIILEFCKVKYTNYFSSSMSIISCCILIVLFYLCLRFKEEKVSKIFTVLIIITCIFMSGLVNPIRKGVDNIYESQLIKEVQKINDVDSGIWIMEGLDFPHNNLLIMAGAPTINSTNVYPAIERWQKLDEKGKYSSVYNRYAHIVIEISDKDETEFELLYPDQFKVTTSIKTLKEELDVKYIFTIKDLSSYSTEEIKLEEIYNKNYKIYKIQY